MFLLPVNFLNGLFQLSVLTAVVVVNEAIEKKNSAQFAKKLNNAGLNSVGENLCNRYLTELIKAKEDKVQVCLNNYAFLLTDYDTL